MVTLFIFIMKTINIPITHNEAFDSIVKRIWNAYVEFNSFYLKKQDFNSFLEGSDVDKTRKLLKQILNKLNKLSVYVK